MQGELLGNYRVEEQLGQGGMGVVYVGRHEQLGHRVAVKVLRPEMSRNDTMVRRFFNEAQAATAIRNPGIVQVFDFGTTADGCAYFVMEMLEGVSLGTRLKERPLDAVECCRIARQIANVLQSAHEVGITHRDLKPDNLFLVPDPEVLGGERVKVLDFGIAKLAGEVHAAGVQTRADVVMGTPSYMSPEQCRGAGAVDTRADIYSLGCVLFKMVCGRAPFVSEGAGDIIGAHLHVPPPSLLDFAPDAPPELAALVKRTLEKQPAARPQTMAAVSQALDEILREFAPARRSTELPVSASAPHRGDALLPSSSMATTEPLGALAATSPASSLATALATPPSASAAGHDSDEEPRRWPATLQGPGGIPASTPLMQPRVMMGAARALSPSGPGAARAYERASSSPPMSHGAGAGAGEAGPPTMTTLGGSAGVSSAQIRTAGRRPWVPWLLGGLAAVGAAVAVTILLSKDDSRPDPSARQMSFSQIEAAAAAAKLASPEAGSAAPAPATPPPTAVAPAPPAAPADDLESECNGFQVDRKWDELAQCAEKLMEVAPQRAAAFKTRAAEERKVQRLAAFEAALREPNLRRARTELEGLADSVDLPKLKARYEEAEKRATNELAQRLERAVTPDCAEHNEILAKERGAQVTRVVTDAVRRAPCTALSRAQCDARALAEEAEKQHKAGKLSAAVAKYDESWYCKQDPKTARQGFIAACITPSAQRAKLFWKRLPADVKPAVIAHCANNGITQQQLDTP